MVELRDKNHPEEGWRVVDDASPYVEQVCWSGLVIVAVLYLIAGASLVLPAVLS